MLWILTRLQHDGIRLNISTLFHPLWFLLDYQRHANYNLTVIFGGVYEKTSPASIAEYHESDGWNIYKIMSDQ